MRARGRSWRQRLEPDAVWRAIDRARQATSDVIGERRELREGARYLRDQLDVLFFHQRQAGWSARKWTDAVLELLYELDAIDLRGLADSVANPRRRQALRRKMLEFVVRPSPSATRK